MSGIDLAGRLQGAIDCTKIIVGDQLSHTYVYSEYFLSFDRYLMEATSSLRCVCA